LICINADFQVLQNSNKRPIGIFNCRSPSGDWLKSTNIGVEMTKNASKKVAKKATKKRVRIEYTKSDVRELRDYSKAKTPLRKIAKATKRSEGSLRQKALSLGLRLGHRR
jgi:hypothetical protein